MSLLSLSVPSRAGEPLVILAEGVGDTAWGKAMGRDAAIWDALRQAVEQALGAFIQSESIVENYQLISDNIFSKTAGYI